MEIHNSRFPSKPFYYTLYRDEIHSPFLKTHSHKPIPFITTPFHYTFLSYSIHHPINRNGIHTTKHSLSFSPFFITSRHGEITGEGAQSDEQMDNGEAQDAFGPDCVFPLGISSRIVTDRCLLMSVKRHRNVYTGVKMW